MCNAWNHSPSCTCGWGGIGHLGRRGPGGYTQFTDNANVYWSVPPIRATYESYVTPNASCPVCGASVFFYQSPYGGRVFFDELGPPWPKHPCTDNTRAAPEPKSISYFEAGNLSQKVYHWQVNGWLPYIISSVRQIDKYVVEIHGACGNRTVLLYISKSMLPVHDDALHKESIAQIRERANGGYELSFISKTVEPCTVKAFLMASQARPEHLSRFKVSHVSRPKPGTASQGKQKSKTQTKSERHHHVSAANRDQAQPRLLNNRNNQNGRGPGKGPVKPRSDNFAKLSYSTGQPHRETQMALAYAAALKKPKQ